MSYNPIKLAYELCRIPSITGLEMEALAFLCAELTNRGLIIEKLPVDSARYNIFAYFKRLSRYTAIFCTHVDTVAPFIEPSLDEEKQILWGRGACDAKGIIAAMVETLCHQHAQGLNDL